MLQESNKHMQIIDISLVPDKTEVESFRKESRDLLAELKKIVKLTDDEPPASPPTTDIDPTQIVTPVKHLDKIIGDYARAKISSASAGTSDEDTYKDIIVNTVGSPSYHDSRKKFIEVFQTRNGYRRMLENILKVHEK